ncbi:MAG: fibronectin type III domain-containing protein [[Clostridium] fimetarium]|nr:fibronectin type III domain-containing protein [Alistipes timonensis]MCM1405124.1 fibronectin type III domain-containing protein [[Clostridium] fimetarium]
MKTFALTNTLAIAAALCCAGEAKALIPDETGPEPTVVFEDDFSLIPAIEPWTGARKAAFNQDETMKPEFFHAPGWKGWYITYGMEAGMAHFETDQDAYIQTPPIELSADGGKVTVTFEYRRMSWAGQTTTTDNFYVQLRDRANGMDKGITGIFANGVQVTTEWKEYSVTLAGGTPDCSVRFWNGSYGGDLRNVKVKQVRPTLDVPVADTFTNFTGTGFTANWRAVDGADHYLLSVFTLGENDERDFRLLDERVDGTTYNVDGLDPAKTYHYTVKARGGELTSGESAPVRCFGVPRPEIRSITDVTADGFRVNWDAPYNANTYQLETFVRHTAPVDGRYYLLDEDFLSTPAQNAQPDSPQRGKTAEWLDDYISRSNWYAKRPAYAADCIGLDNTYASMGEYGELDGPTMDLSADGGKVTIEMRVRARNAASLSLYMMNVREKVNEFTSDVIASRVELWDTDSRLDPLTEEWTDRVFTLTGGNAESYIAIQAYGYGALVQIDRLAISQELKAGESVRVPYRSVVTGACEAYIATNGEGFSNTADEFECELMGAYIPNPGQDEPTVTSPWSDIESVRLPEKSSRIAAATANGSITIATSGGRIVATNPARGAISVYTASGTLVASGDSESFATPALPSGIYIVATPEGAAKVAL